MQNEELFKFYGKITDIVEVTTDEINSLCSNLNSNILTSYNEVLTHFFLDNFILVIDRKNSNYGAFVYVINEDDKLILKVTYNSFINSGIKDYETIEFLKETQEIIKTPSPKAMKLFREYGISEEELDARFNKSCDMYLRTVLFLSLVSVLNSKDNEKQSSELFSRTTMKFTKTKNKNSKHKPSKVSLFKKYTVNSNNLDKLNYSIKDFNYKVASWGVSGHYRHYKNGTKRWIKPGVRHRRKGQPELTGYAPKTYVAN